MRISDWSSDVCSSDLIHLDIVGHLPDVHLRREQLCTFRCVDAVIAAVPGGGAGDPHMPLGGPGLAQHLPDLEAGGAAHDPTADQHNPRAADPALCGLEIGCASWRERGCSACYI